MKTLNKYFDHTLLKADALPSQIIHLCKEAIEYNFYSVCVNSCYVDLAAKELANSDVKIACVVGFPLGATTSKTKAFETEEACKAGASEVDMVINIGMLKANNYDYVENDISSVVDIASDYGSTVKVILETCLLTKDEIVKGCQIAEASGARFVKTSTGFSSGGATVDDIKLMKATVGEYMEVKASGGIRDYKTTMEMINAGADRIGASASIDIIKTAK